MYKETYSGEFVVHLVIFMAVLKFCQNKKDQTFVGMLIFTVPDNSYRFWADLHLEGHV